MKRKLLSLLLIGVMVLGLTGCEEKKLSYADANATLELENEKIQITSEEIKKVYDDNIQNFKKNYFGKKITFIGTVESVKENSIVFNEGWEFELDGFNTCNIISSDLKANDEVIVVSWLFDAFGPTTTIRTQAGSNGSIIMMVDKNFTKDELLSIAESFYKLYVFMEEEGKGLTYYNNKVTDGPKSARELGNKREYVAKYFEDYNFDKYAEDIKLLASKYPNLSTLEEELNSISKQTKEYSTKFLEAYSETGCKPSMTQELVNLGKEIIQKNKNIKEKIIEEVSR